MKATRLLLGMMLVATPVLAATLRVPSEYANIQTAIDAAAEGDTVLVAPGTYTGHGFHSIDFSTTTWPDPHNVVLMSEAGPDVTVLDIQGSAVSPRRGFVFHTSETRESVVDGFTITNGWMSTGPAQGFVRHDLGGGGMVVRFQTGPTIRNCIFLNNHSEFSGGALETELLATPLIEDCAFMGNTSSAAGGAISIETQAAPVIRRCTITGNVAGTFGGAVSFQSQGSQFGLVEFTDCTVAGNRAEIGGGIDALFPADGVIIERSIIWGNCATISGGDVSAQASAGFDFMCSAVDSTNAEGAGTITYDSDCVFTDPLFCAREPCTNAPTTAGDYTLAENSPCTAENSPCSQLIGSLGIGCGPVTTTTHLVLADGTGDYPTIQDAIDAAVDGDTIELGDGTFAGDGNRDLDYLGKALTIRSRSGDASACVIDCEGSPTDPHRAFIFQSGEQRDASLSAVGIRNGYAASFDVGGGIFCSNSSPSIEFCVIEHCEAYWGGGLASDSGNPLMQGCLFRENTARDDGGGLSIAGGSAEIVQCRIVSNQALDSGGTIAGGGLQVGSATVQIDQSLFTTNSASGGGGAVAAIGGSTTIARTTLTSNSATSGSALYVTGEASIEIGRCIVWDNADPDPVAVINGAMLVSCSDVRGGWPGSDNFDSDPLFCDAEHGDFGLQSDSPCLPGNHPDGADCGVIGAFGESCPHTLDVDLAAVGFQCSPDTAWSGPGEPDSLVISGIFANSGNVVVDNFSVRIEIEGCIPFWGDTRLFGPLSPGDQDTIHATFPVQPAQCTATLIVDELNEVEEIDEENNILLDVPVCVVIGTPDQPLIPTAMSLRAYPNPSSGSIRLAFGTPSPSGGKLSIYDVAGRRVWWEDVQSHSGVVPWDRRSTTGLPVAAGTYFVNFETRERTETRRILLIR